MGRPKYTKEECVDKIMKLQNEIGWDKSITQKLLTKHKLNKMVYLYWDNMTNMKNELKIPLSDPKPTKRYTDKELLDIVYIFVEENNFFPSSEYWGNNSSRLGLPCLAVYTKHFGSWQKVRKIFNEPLTDYMIEQNGIYKNRYDDKDTIMKLFYETYEKLGRVPTTREFDKVNKHCLAGLVKKYFGSYNNLVIEAGYRPNTRQVFTDEYLKECFLNFVKENKRVPTIRDFNERPDLPGVAPYIDRFGTWGKACIFYGFKPNARQPEYYLENGERCDSSYEFIVSNWLIDNNYQYERNVKYRDIDKKYNGSMNCDYLIHNNKMNWYVEIVGMLWSKDYKPTTDETITYYQKLKRKEELLIKNGLSYKFIYANEFKNNTIDELFSFLR